MQIRPLFAPGLLALLTFYAADAASSAFTPAHVAKLRMVRGAEISPDGRYIMYGLAIPRKPFEEDSGPAKMELHIVDTSGKSRPLITTGSFGGAQWTPDGKGISFLAKRGKDKHRNLYVLPLDGGEAVKVLSHSTGIANYAWHPKMTTVAFVAKDKEDSKVKEEKKKGFNQEVVEEQFRNSQLWLKAPTPYSYNPEAKPADDAKKISVPGSVTSVKFSPVGTHLIVSAKPTPSIDDHYMKSKLHVVELRRKRVVAKFNTPGKLGRYEFSPSGNKVAFITALDINDPSEGRLGIGKVESGKMTTYLADYEGEVQSISWSDDETVVYLAAEGAQTTLATIGADGKNNKTIIGAKDRVLRGLTVSRDGRRLAMLGQSPKHPDEVFYMALTDSAPKRLTNSNLWLKDMKFAKQEVIRYKAKDGVEIEGIFIHPKNGRKKAPLIVAVHGGPESHIRNGWLTYYSYPGQTAAAEGFAVFYPNYRGSTGRGVKFSKAGQADYAGKEFDDIIDGIDHLAKQGLINPKKVGVTGGSYGGFASAWMATKHTKRFAASVMFVGISDQISKFGTTDIPNEMFHVHARKWPWQDWAFFRERSPITYVEQARTPILIMHGKNDTRVHPTQSMELFRYLKTIGKTPVRLVLYPGEGHGNRKSAARLDYNLRLLRWMKHYLKGKGGKPPPEKLDYGPYKPKDKKKKKKK